jgi:hypothetical protein
MILDQPKPDRSELHATSPRSTPVGNVQAEARSSAIRAHDLVARMRRSGPAPSRVTVGRRIGAGLLPSRLRVRWSPAAALLRTAVIETYITQQSRGQLLAKCRAKLAARWSSRSIVCRPMCPPDEFNADRQAQQWDGKGNLKH